jgi:uncharacterized membrane protein
MHPLHFLNRLEHEQVVAAIRDAEAKTTGQIHVVVSRRKIANALDAARRHFEKVELHRSAHRNAILIFVAPRSHTFAVVGDQAIHDRVGDAAWRGFADTMAGHFKAGQFMTGVLAGIVRAGELLAEHFPKG